ncbi:helix-turn-helix protein [Halovivax asiaticus JCM 14624]|uniref:Helix-turn-helix protein n=1 Tax=Halovivax asiaticus JCM 14624 TaxID=1227490 RepID=M0B8B0_9EURY|nr:helix-turn-helix transcriptional regulator [Halovivax asiaticus]ELZ07156.1 helix-turn-helix protein [Halovivax asiaticus JCM 14624]
MDNNLRVKRAEREITQQELADAVDVSRQTIYAIEKSKYDPSLELAFSLANYFDCSIEDIFDPAIDN